MASSGTRRDRAPRLPLLAALAAIALGASAGCAQAPPPEGGEARFPSLSGTSLSGRRFTLPEGFEGRANLVFVAFRREQQALVDTWLPAAREAAFASPEMRFYELPTIGRAYLLMRPVIEGGMRGGVTDRAARDATITLYTDTGRFRRALRIPDDRTIHVLLLDRAGTVRWRAEGGFTPDKGAALTDAVERLLGAP